MSDEKSFVFVTDIHIGPGGRLILGAGRPGEIRIETASNLRRVLERVRAMRLDPLCFVFGGDLTNNGETEGYEHIRDLMGELNDTGVPVLLALGNHDGRIPFRRVMLGEQGAADEHERYYYTRSFDDLRIIVLDSMIPGETHGELGDEQISWLDAELGRGTEDTKDVIVIHHPSIPRGVPRPDDYLLKDREKFETVVGRHRPMAVLCGHSHVPTAAAFGGTVHYAGPASAFMLDPSIRKGARAMTGAGFTICTVRESRLVINPVLLEGDQEELFRHGDT